MNTQRGVIYAIKEPKTISDKFSMQEIIINTSGQYPQYLCFQATNAKMSLLSGLQAGDELDIQFELRGRLWRKDPQAEEKVFNTLDIISLNKLASAITSPTLPSNSTGVADLTPQTFRDDLPF